MKREWDVREKKRARVWEDGGMAWQERQESDIRILRSLSGMIYFIVDKTGFIKECWENKDAVTLVTRPRRFGRTLTMSMLEYFFSVKYADGASTKKKIL